VRGVTSGWNSQRDVVDGRLTMSFSPPPHAAAAPASKLRCTQPSPRSEIYTSQRPRGTDCCREMRKRNAIIGSDGLWPETSSGTFVSVKRARLSLSAYFGSFGATRFSRVKRHQLSAGLRVSQWHERTSPPPTCSEINRLDWVQGPTMFLPECTDVQAQPRLHRL
jgi:hypothetical protein